MAETRTGDKVLSITFPSDQLYAKIVELSEREDRSLAGMVRILVREAIDQREVKNG